MTSITRRKLNDGYYAVAHTVLAAVFILLAYLKYLRRVVNLLVWPEMSIYYQSLLSTCQGHILAQHLESHWIGADSISLLGSHAEYIQLVFAPVVCVFRSHEMLLLAQLICLAAGSAAISLYARDTLGLTVHQRLAVVTVYLFHPYMSLQAHRFHPFAMVVPLQALLLLFLARKSRTGILVTSGVIALCREDTVLFLVPFSLLFLVPDKRLRAIGWIVGAGSVAMSALGTLVVIPHFAGRLVHGWRYEYLRDFPGDPLGTLARIPVESFALYLLFLLLPLLCLPVLHWRWLLTGICSVGQLCFSSNPTDLTFLRHYGLITLVPFLAGTLPGLAVRRRWLRTGICTLLVLLSTGFTLLDYHHLHETGHIRFNPAVTHLFDLEKVPEYDEITGIINECSGVMSLPSNLIPFSLNNTDVHPFPRKLMESDLAVFDQHGDYYPHPYSDAAAALENAVNSGEFRHRELGRFTILEPIAPPP